MSDTLQEGEDQMDQHQVTKSGTCVIPGCPCRGWSAQETVTEFDDKLSQVAKEFGLGAGEQEILRRLCDRDRKHQPATRGGGDEWYTDSRRSTDATIYTRIGNQWVGQVHARFADQIVTEHNQHQSLVAERERLRRMLAAVINAKCNNGPPLTEEQVSEIARWWQSELQRNKQRSTSE